MRLRKEVLAVVGIAAVVVASLLIVVEPGPRTAQAAANGMAIDATSGGSVDATRAVSGTATFSLGINVTAAPATYIAYQWEIAYSTGGLQFVGPVVEFAKDGTFDLCVPGAINLLPNPARPDETVYGKGAGCLEGGQEGSTFVGQTESFGLKCLADGVFPVTLLRLITTAVAPGDETIFGSSMTDANSANLNPTLAGVTITCSGTGVTLPTPTATNTPLATDTPQPTAAPTDTPTPCVGAGCPTASPTLLPVYTRTPTRTATSVVPPPPAPTQGSTGQLPPPSGGSAGAAPSGGARSGIRLPDTGVPDTAASGTETWWMLLAIVGGGAVVAGASLMLLRGRPSR